MRSWYNSKSRYLCNDWNSSWVL